MSIDKCPICDEYIFWDKHTCKPCFYVWREFDEFLETIDYSKYKIFAHDEESAAVSFADHDWEFPDQAEVWVVDRKTGDEIVDNYYDDTGRGDLTEEGWKLLKEKSLYLNLESEVVRNFYAREIEKPNIKP
jgi:hypothetical protein